MRKRLAIITLLVPLLLVPMICTAQESLSDASLQASSENSSQESTGASSETSSQESTAASSENSSQNSSEYSSQWSTDTTSNSWQTSTDTTTEQSGNSDSSSIALLVSGAAVTIAITVGGIILTVRVSKAKKENVLRLQDQIYLAEGKDYRDILAYFELADRDLIKANDELVAAGCRIASDQDAADYLASLILKLAQRSGKVQYELSVL